MYDNIFRQNDMLPVHDIDYLVYSYIHKFGRDDILIMEIISTNFRLKTHTFTPQTTIRMELFLNRGFYEKCSLYIHYYFISVYISGR